MDATTLRNQFEDELATVDTFVNLLQDRALVSAQGVTRLVRTLERFDIDIVAKLPNFTFVPRSYTDEELQSIHSFLKAVKPRLDTAFAEAEVEVVSVEQPARLSTTDARSFEGECIQYVLDIVEGEKEEHIDWKNIEKELYRVLNGQEDADEIVGFSSQNELVDFVVRSVIFIKASRRANELFEAIEVADEIDANLRIIQRGGTINVFRQGFILLMTLFDATIFDLMRLALRHRFFELIGTVAKQDRLGFDRFAQHSSFESFRDEIIEEKLKQKYLKDILSIINSRGIQLVDPPYTYGHLIELVLRRNIHVHNRGYVDERYLERNDRGEVMFNFDSYSLVHNGVNK